MIRTLWGYLAVRLLAVWTLVALVALVVWMSGLPLYVRFGLLAMLLVFQWTVVDRWAGLRTGSGRDREPRE